jgi:hypothetical protein
MEKVKADRDIDKVLDKLITEKLIRHTCQFFEKDNDGFKPYGSGVFAFIHETHFILTASHVAKAFSDDTKDLFIRVGEKKYINVLGEIKLTDLDSSSGVDLAYIKIDQSMVEPLSIVYEFLKIDKVRKHNKMLDAMNYCVIGFPENNVNRNNGFLNTGASAYFTVPSNNNPYEYYKYSKDDWFIVDIKGKGTDIKSGEVRKINTHFNGISGCGLWYFVIDIDQSTNEYDYDYRLIGIMTEYKKGKYFCLIGNKIHLIIEAFRAIEKMKFKGYQ